MVNGMRNFILIFTLALFCTAMPLFPQEFQSRYEISNFTSRYLEEKGFDVQETHFVPKHEGKFPYNITVEIEKAEITKSNMDEFSMNSIKNPIEDVIFAFTQDFFCTNPGFIVDFINQTKANHLPYNCTMLFACDAEHVVLDVPQKVQGGTDFFADRLYDSDSTCAYVIFDEEVSPKQIRTTGGGNISPMWIVKTAEKAYRTNQQPISVQSGLLYSTKSSFFKETPRLSSFKKNEIICAGIPLGHTLKDLDILRTIQMDLIESRNSERNTHYNNLSFGSLSIWINESALTVIYLTFAVIVLVSLCFSSFTYNAKNEAIFRDIARTWFTLPAYILTSTLFLFIFQKVFLFSKDYSPIIYYTLKTFFSILLLFILSSLQIMKRLRISISAISFQTKTICALNIFVFTFMDLSLMFVFIIHYLIVFFSHKTQNKILTISSLVMLVIPMLHPSTSLFLNTDPVKIGNFLNASMGPNIMYSMILIPFVFQWIRCALILNIGEHANGKYRKLFTTVITSCIFCMILFSIFTCGTVGIVHTLTKAAKSEFIMVEDISTCKADYEYSHTDSFDMVNHVIKIKCPEGKRIERCIATLTSQSGSPLYDSNFNYTMKSSNEAVLEIPDGADEDIALMFSTDTKSTTRIFIDLYMLTDRTHAVHETKEIELAGRTDVGKAI